MKPPLPPRKRNLAYWLRLLAFFVGLLYLSVILIIPLQFGIQQIRPAHSQVCCKTPQDHGLEFESVTFQTQDGLTLRGWHIPSRNGAVVITLHGYGGNRLGTLGQAVLLAQHGYGVLLYDQRASGESDGENLSWGWRDVADVSDAVQYLQAGKRYAPAQIGIYGCSTGAEIALASTALNGDLRAVAAEDAEYSTTRDILIMPDWKDQLFFPGYHLFIKVMEWRSGTSASISLSEAVGRISPRPLLLISNGQDFDYIQAQYYFDLAKEPKEHWNLPNSYHCGGLTTHPQEYETKLTGFFDAAFR
jgi:pimeloyl-ACP methyl ester carboxylesterase